MNTIIAPQRKCPVCGKSYELRCRPDEWGFAYGDRLVCSYHCMRALEKQHQGRYQRQTVSIAWQSYCYRQHLKGRPYEDMLGTRTMESNGVKTVEQLVAKVEKWMERNPQEAKAVRESVEMEDTMLTLTQVKQQTGLHSDTIYSRANALGIIPKRDGVRTYFSPEEAERIAGRAI